MAKVTITLVDKDEFGLDVSFEADPPLERGSDLTVSQSVAMQFLDFLAKNGEVKKVSDDDPLSELAELDDSE